MHLTIEIQLVYYRHMFDYIKSDVYRYYGRFSFALLIKLILWGGDAYRALLSNRLANIDLNNSRISLILQYPFKVILRVASASLRLSSMRCSIPRGVRIGYGLYIGHGGPVIINETAVIGNNCNLSQYTTIGSNSDHAAVIGDNVYIGPSCCLVENVSIGNNVTIGAGSIVTKDVPQNATVAGNPAKVLNYRSPGRFIRNVWNVN